MITVALVNELGKDEACARMANSKGYCCATTAAFALMFPGEWPGRYQELTVEGTTLHVATVGGNTPPGSFSVS